MALSTVLLAMLLAAPFINVLVWRGGARWLAAYGVVLALGAVAAALAVALTVALFRTIGPKRTRLVAQIVAAVDRRGLCHRAANRRDPLATAPCRDLTFLKSDWLIALAPAIDSLVWWPARAVLGDVDALPACSAQACALLAAAIALFSARFGDHAIAAAGIAEAGEAPAPLVATASAVVAAAARCAARNGRCCFAIPG